MPADDQISGRAFVQLSPIPWNASLYQRPQHMATAFGRLGVQTVYSTAFWEGENTEDARLVGKTPAPNVMIRNIQDSVSGRNSGLVYSFYSTDLTVSWQSLQSLRQLGNILIYEYIDEIDPAISEGAAELLFRHECLISPATVDYIVVSADALMEEMSTRFPEDRILLVPNGVDMAHYLSHLSSPYDVQAVRTVLPTLRDGHPVVGYFGAIAPWLDYELIRSVASDSPDLEFVFIGPDYDASSAARVPMDLPNVHRTGPIPYQLLPRIARCFSIAWIPFAPGAIAETTSPLKLFEYMALGLEVVAPTWMRECMKYDDVLRGSSTESILAAIRRGLESRSEARVSQLQEVAWHHDWTERAAVIADRLVLDGAWTSN